MTTAKVTKVLLKRGNTIQNDTYTGVYGELSIDMEANTLRIHDGVVAGGNVVSGSGGGTGGTNYANANVKAYLTSFDGNIVPTGNGVQSLGSITHQWKSLFVSNNTIYINGVPIGVTNTGNLTVNNKTLGSTITYGDINGAPTDIADLTDIGNLLIGTPGPQGNTGATGATGATGTSISSAQVIGGNLKITFSNAAFAWAGNVTGPQGIQGEKGNTGDQGPTGAEGPRGLQGIQGNVGPAGAQGIQGIQGNVGSQGPRGFTGNVGEQGPQGERGLTGNTGAQGVSVTLKGSVDIVANLPMTGNAGEGWIVQGDGNLYIWNSTTVHWDDIGQIVGPQGDPGPQGPRGFTGNVGAAGPQGDQGPQGPQGSQGIQGNVGTQGEQGIQGNVGDQGPQGNAGVGVSPGGTIGQFLGKNSSDDYDTSWQDVSKLINGVNELVLNVDGTLTMPDGNAGGNGAINFNWEGYNWARISSTESTLNLQSLDVVDGAPKTTVGIGADVNLITDALGSAYTWTFNTDGKLTLPNGGTIAGTLPLIPPETITITGADWSGANGVYTRVDAVTNRWNPASGDSYIVFDVDGWGIKNPGFGTTSIYVNAGTLGTPLTQWELNPPLGSVPPTGTYLYTVSPVQWTFNSAGHLVPGTDVLQDIGTPTNRIRHIYVGPGSISIGDSVLSESTTGKLVVPGLTRATSLHADEVEDTGDQTTSFGSVPIIIDYYEWSVQMGATPDPTYVAAEYSVQ